MISGIGPPSGNYRRINGTASQQLEDGSEDEENSSLMSHGVPMEESSSPLNEPGYGLHVSTDLSPIRSSRRNGRQRPSQLKSPRDYTVRHDFFRSVSREGSGPMNHPTPDLQTIYGAYVGNVERLEQSAERLSMGSDVGEELRKLKQEQKRSESHQSLSYKPPSRQFSAASHSNSILALNTVARSGGYSTEGYVMSPINRSPIRSPSWSHVSQGERQAPGGSSVYSGDMIEDEDAARSPISYRSGKLSVRNEDQALQTHEEREEQDSHHEYDKLYETAKNVVNRTVSNASKTTFQQAEDAFAEFDGTHIHDAEPTIAEEREEEDEMEAIAEGQHLMSPRIMEPPPLQNPTSRSPARNPGEPPAGMVYYPAPVPVMLNLPPKISKGPSSAQIAERRSRMLAGDNKVRRSTANLLSENAVGETGSTADPTSPGESKLPPQLRATMYFDQSPARQDVEIQGGSAMATLDSILDASAFAPVTAFTDHPMVGQVGNKDVYGAVRQNARKSRNTLNLQRETSRMSFLGFNRKSRLLSAEETADGAQEDLEDDDEDFASPTEDDLENSETAKPTTLLAELQLRKKQQQSRNKTAANAFPAGMRATLLQMDAVAQVQRESRKHKHVTLAWEEAGTGLEDEDSDEDVPLAMLQQRKDGVSPGEEDRPLGLLAQRQFEDSEPLSARRARLRGEPLASPGITGNQSRLTLRPVPDALAAAAEPEDENEDEAGETLAQRRRRLKIQDAIPQARPVSGDFASELMSHLGVPNDADADTSAASATARAGAEETLGQRRKRLQAERLATEKPNQTFAQAPTKQRTSMANLLSQYPGGEAGQTQPARRTTRPPQLQHSSTAPITSPTAAPPPQLRPSPTMPIQRQSSYLGGLSPAQAQQVQQIRSQIFYPPPPPQAAAPPHPTPLASTTYMPPPSGQMQTSWADGAGTRFGGAALFQAPVAQAPLAQAPQVYYPGPVPAAVAHHVRLNPMVAAAGMGQLPAGEDARRAMIDRWRQSVV